MMPRPFVRDLHRVRRGFLANVFLWGLGNGLLGSSLVVYVLRALAEGALDKIALGLAVSWCIAAPRLIGCLRILTPSLIDYMGSRKRVCVLGYFLSPLVLALLPIFMPVFAQCDKQYLNGILLLVGLIWAIYHLVEYFGTVALWSWMGDSLSRRTRARFLAVRERYLLMGQLPAMITGGLWTWFHPGRFGTPAEKLEIYMLPAVIGILFLLLAAIPLLYIPEIPWGKTSSFRERIHQMLAPLVDRRFLLLILFACWLQLAGGLIQGPQSLFLMNVLSISLLGTLLLNSMTRLGQIALSNSVGRLMERLGSRRVMIFSLLFVTAGSLFYISAEHFGWFMIIPAALCWIFWIGVNLGIQNLMLTWAPFEHRSSYIALYMTATTLVFGLATMLGGWLLDLFRNSPLIIPVPGNSSDSYTLDYYTICFAVVSLLRFMAIIPLLILWRSFWNTK